MDINYIFNLLSRYTLKIVGTKGDTQVVLHLVVLYPIQLQAVKGGSDPQVNKICGTIDLGYTEVLQNYKIVPIMHTY